MSRVDKHRNDFKLKGLPLCVLAPGVLLMLIQSMFSGSSMSRPKSRVQHSCRQIYVTGKFVSSLSGNLCIVCCCCWSPSTFTQLSLSQGFNKLVTGATLFCSCDRQEKFRQALFTTTTTTTTKARSTLFIQLHSFYFSYFLRVNFTQIFHKHATCVTFSCLSPFFSNSQSQLFCENSPRSKFFL